MNIAVKPGPETRNPEKVLAGRVSLITGSTSGIGLGIARALAAAGSQIVLNGFGKPEEVDRYTGRRSSPISRSGCPTRRQICRNPRPSAR